MSLRFAEQVPRYLILLARGAWAESSDVSQMLRDLNVYGDTQPYVGSRLLRNWCLACRRSFEPGHGEAVLGSVWHWERWARDPRTWVETLKADILRDLVGDLVFVNDLPSSQDRCGKCYGKGRRRKGSGRIGTKTCRFCCGKGVASPWLSEDVLAISRGLYSQHHEGVLPAADMLVLADALRDAGCPEMIFCEPCGGTAVVRVPGDKGDWDDVWCRDCHDDQSGRVRGVRSAHPGMRPNPVLTHLRAGGPHYVGCHVAELLLGNDPMAD